ncbi:hypothetical protein MNBD_PLANCTO03-2293 [hydrothermal vent metagenome]|uniref:Uncharacterized protein n=1 Tax=hydrothermal vent metagenome TaxID=652676 RepID=A0A3B1DNY5_9ZZZZ
MYTPTPASPRLGTRYLKIASVALVAAALLLTPAATAQPERRLDAKPTDRPAQRERPQRDGVQRERPQRDRAQRSTDTQLEPRQFRARLASMLDQLESSTEHLRGAIETLDAGGTVDEAIQKLGGPLRARRLAEMWAQWGHPGEADRPVRAGADSRPPQRGQGNGVTDQARRPWGGRDASPEEIRAFLRENAPQLAERLDRLRKDDPQRADGFVARLRPRVAEILSTRAHDPELAELLARDFRIGMLVSDVAGGYVRALAAGEKERAAELQAELRTLAAEQVDLRLARREHEISQLASRLALLQAEVEAQREKREELIDEVIERAGQARPRGAAGDRPGRGSPSERPGRRHRRNNPNDG